MHVGWKQRLYKSLPDFPVGVSQVVNAEIGVISFDSKITALIEHRNRTHDSFGRCVELLVDSLDTFQGTDIEIGLTKQVYQESRSARREPEVLVLLCIEGVEQAERVIDVGTMLAEMITVIPLFQMNTCFLESFVVRFGHPLDVRFQFRQQLLLGDAADSAEVIAHADILQIVQLAEDTHLAELADAGDEKEAEILPHTLEGAEEIAHDSP